MKFKKKILVIIPAYNEDNSIGKVIKITLAQNLQCVVIDDGSTDQTATVAKKTGAHILQNIQNLGSGVSMRIGLEYAIKKKADIVITMDADGQHDPKYIAKLLHYINEGNDYVIASRYYHKTDHATSFIRRIGTKTISLFIQIFYQRAIKDPTSGFRAMTRNILITEAIQYPTIFSEPELLLNLLDREYQFCEIPCEMNKRKYGKSSISSKKAIFLMFYILFKIMYRGSKFRLHSIYNR